MRGDGLKRILGLIWGLCWGVYTLSFAGPVFGMALRWRDCLRGDAGECASLIAVTPWTLGIVAVCGFVAWLGFRAAFGRTGSRNGAPPNSATSGEA